MKTDKIIWGLVLVFIGGILLLQNFDIIDFQWIVVWRFWPLILILIGANMLFSRDNSRGGAIVSILLTVAALAFIGWQGSTRQEEQRSSWLFNEDEDSTPIRGTRNQTYSEPFNPGTRNATLNISGGATTYIIRDTTNSLFSAKVNSKFGNYSLKKISKDSSEILDFKMSGKGEWGMNDHTPNQAIVALNVHPVWDINVETGAGKADLDLAAFKVRNLSFEGGATKLDVKLGQPVQVTNVSVETGVSKIHISIPNGVACRISTDSGLSSNSFPGFEKQEDGTYITPNFNTAFNKIVINLEGGLSKFVVDRY